MLLPSFRTYALRRVKDSFRENLHVDNPKTLDMLLNQARENLAVIRRQVSDSSVVLIYMCILWMLIVSRIAYSNIQLGNALWIVK